MYGKAKIKPLNGIIFKRTSVEIVETQLNKIVVKLGNIRWKYTLNSSDIFHENGNLLWRKPVE
jgi:hypothetical protein